MSYFECLDDRGLVTALTCVHCKEGQVAMLPAPCPHCRKVLTEPIFDAKEVLPDGRIRQFVKHDPNGYSRYFCCGVFYPYVPLQITDAFMGEEEVQVGDKEGSADDTQDAGG